MLNSRKLRWVILMVSGWLFAGILLPILLPLILQTPQVIPYVLIAVNIILVFVLVVSWLAIKLITWAEKGK